MLRLLKSHFRKADIFWWIDSSLAPLLEGDPDLAGLVRFERRRWEHPQNWPEMISSIRWLRAQKFDLVIDLQCLLRSAVFGWLARQDFLIGLDETREGARGFYDIAVPRKSFHTHAVDWYLSVLPRLGVPVHPHYEWLPARPAVAESIQLKWKTAGSRWIMLQPGARWDNKRWPAENFARLVSSLGAELAEARFAILGSQEDRALGEIIVQANPSRSVNLCGATSLPEMVEWIRLGDVLITNDTGPMHVAAALGKPTVALFGPTEPRRTGPYGQLQNVLRLDLPCSPCMKSTCHFETLNECLRGLSIATVAERIKKMLPQSTRSGVARPSRVH